MGARFGHQAPIDPGIFTAEKGVQPPAAPLGHVMRKPRRHDAHQSCPNLAMGWGTAISDE